MGPEHVASRALVIGAGVPYRFRVGMQAGKAGAASEPPSLPLKLAVWPTFFVVSVWVRSSLARSLPLRLDDPLQISWLAMIQPSSPPRWTLICTCQ